MDENGHFVKGSGVLDEGVKSDPGINRLFKDMTSQLAGHSIAAAIKRERPTKAQRAEGKLGRQKAGGLAWEDWATDPAMRKLIANSLECDLNGDPILVGGAPVPRKKKDTVAPAAVLLHDSGGKRGDLTELAERLQKQGFVVLVPDLRGHGDSVQEGGTPFAEMDEAARERLWAFAMRDVRACADFLHKQDGVHASNLSLLGYRAGATLAARHAVRDENVRCVVLLGPKSEQLGFNLQQDVEDLGGLPTYIGVAKDGSADAELLAASAQDANGGLDFVEIAIFKTVVPKPIEDKRMPADIAKWMMEQAVPKKGRDR